MFIVCVLKDRVLKLNLDNAVKLQDSVDVKHLDIARLVNFAFYEEVIDVLHSVGLLDICWVDTIGLVRICKIEEIHLLGSFQILYDAQLGSVSDDDLINNGSKLLHSWTLFHA